MKIAHLLVAAVVVFALVPINACKEFGDKSPDVVDAVRKSLDQQGLKDVTVSQDRDKGIVTLGGQVATDQQKTQAESITNSLAGGQVVADQIAIVAPGTGKEVGAINSDLDQGIEKNLDAALIQAKMHADVSYAVKNGVVTLSGEVDSDAERTSAESIAGTVPNVHQVVNVLQVTKNRKASSGM
jgi:hyperosmotically inducible protein